MYQELSSAICFWTSCLLLKVKRLSNYGFVVSATEMVVVITAAAKLVRSGKMKLSAASSDHYGVFFHSWTCLIY